MVWEVSPLKLADAVQVELRQGITQALRDKLEAIRAEAESHMRQNAPWQDQTGAARAGLVVAVEETAEGVVMWFIHSVEYGKYLELKNAGSYAIIVPTMYKTIPEIQAALAGLI